MCTQIYLPDGNVLSSIQEVFDAGFDIKPVDIDLLDESKKTWAIEDIVLPDECLCNLDVEAILSRSEIPFKMVFGSDYEIEKLPNND